MSFQQNEARIHKQYPSRSRQEGVVIVVALFIVALVATMAYAMMARLERDTRRTTLILRDTQAEFYAQGSIAWAMDQLRNNFEKQKPKQLVDITPIKSPEMDEDGYHIVSTIYDMQARYNLNNLAVPDAQIDFKRMLQAVMPNMTEQQALQIARAVNDWIMPGAQQNEFSKYYSTLPKPYRPSHKPMLSVSELRLVKGVTANIFNALQPYVAALPPPTPVNVQNASAPILMTLGPSVTLETGKIIEQLRDTAPFTSTQDFLNLDIVKNHPIAPDKITMTSAYFLVETDVTIEKQHIVLYTLLQRDTNDRKAFISIVWQSKGVW